MYKLKHKKPVYFDYDLLVIGTGAGGGVAAHLATAAGKKVAVIEAEKIGGECPNYGCVPTKSLLQAAEIYNAAKEGERFGIDGKGVKFDYKKIKAWKDEVVAKTGTEEGEEFYHKEHVKVIHGHAHFINPWTVSVGARRYTARNFMIATGTRAVVPPIAGLAEAGYMTYRQGIDLDELPESVFVVGGGPIGCEFAHLFSSLGSKVHVAEMAPRLIAMEDAEVGELLGALFERRGIEVHTGVKVVRVTKEGRSKVVHFEKDGQIHSAKVAEVMVASGMSPNTDLGLENAGVSYDRGGINVNKYMQTSAKHIYAAGDVVGPYRFTHTAAYQSRIAAHNMYHRDERQKVKANYTAVPRCVFVDPELASVGLSEQQLKDKKIPYQVGAVPISVIGRAGTSGVENGFVKVLASKHGTILGASIASPRAGEMIHELALAVQHRMTARQIAETIHAFPTWSEAVRKACQRLKSK